MRELCAAFSLHSAFLTTGQIVLNLGFAFFIFIWGFLNALEILDGGKWFLSAKKLDYVL